MYSHSRKLLIHPEFDDDPSTTTNVIVPHHFSSASPPTNSQSSPPLDTTSPASSSDPHQSYNTSNQYTSCKLSSSFDSSMALTVLVLLTAFFFMGFFSLYIRRFAEDSSADPSTFLRRRRRGGHNSSTASLSAPNSRASKGVDQNTIRSLPVYRFSGEKDAAAESSDMADCTICLSEFELGEWLKWIPFCGHVFHVDCIDAWLGSHRTCPLCRTEKIFGFARPKEAVALAEEEEGVEMGTGLTTVDESDTWRVVVEVGNGGGVRRSSSWSWDVLSSSVVVGPVRDDERLHRSFSF